MAAVPSELVGTTGRRYRFKELLQERPYIGRVWTATTEQDNHQYVLKDNPKGIHENFYERVKPNVRESPLIRLPVDEIPEQRIFVYNYLKEDLLSLVRKRIPLHTTRHILRESLRGIAELHDQDIVHLDVKADNVIVDYQQNEDKIVIEQVQITDLENAAHLPSGKAVKGMLAGNENWRSPEAFYRGRLSKPTDIYSFGVVCIYAVLGRVIFGPDEDFYYHVEKGALPDQIRLQGAVCYFGDKDGINGLLRHISDDEFNSELLCMLWEDRNEDYIPYKPFEDWEEISDAVFKDLIRKMMSLDPKRRITAHQALEHPWFAEH